MHAFVLVCPRAIVFVHGVTHNVVLVARVMAC